MFNGLLFPCRAAISLGQLPGLKKKVPRSPGAGRDRAGPGYAGGLGQLYPSYFLAHSAQRIYAYLLLRFFIAAFMLFSGNARPSFG